MTRAWAVATARRLSAGLTVCVYMDVHAYGLYNLWSMRLTPVRCRVLLHSLLRYLLMMPVARLVCQRPSSTPRHLVCWIISYFSVFDILVV